MTEPDPIANLDQVMRGLKDRARLLHIYFRDLTEQGFTEDQAMRFALQLDKSIEESGESEE